MTPFWSAGGMGIQDSAMVEESSTDAVKFSGYVAGAVVAMEAYS